MRDWEVGVRVIKKQKKNESGVGQQDLRVPLHAARVEGCRFRVEV